MALQVCEYPTCKKLTLTKRCHAHPLEEGETDDELDKRLTKILTTKEPMMNEHCNNPNCAEPKAPDSVKCVRHRDQQKRANENYARLHPKGKPAKPAQLPAKRIHASITLSEPRIVNSTPASSVDLNGNAVTVLNSFINKLTDDLATLQGAKDILEGWRG
jgi:hypothetical protein